MSAKRYAKVMRNHWGIENNLHWQLDVSFGEDNNRVSKRNGAENLAMFRWFQALMRGGDQARKTDVYGNTHSRGSQEG